MIIVLLMLTSALAGCTGDDTNDLEQQIEDLQQSNEVMSDTLYQRNQDNAELQSQLEERNTEIAILNSNVAMLQSSIADAETYSCLLYTSPSPRDQRGSRMPSSA